MTKRFSLGMAQATDLTRAGKLAEATDLIRSLLTPGASHDAAPAEAAVLPDPDVIEGTFTPVAPKRRAAAAKKAKPSGLKETLRRIAAGGMPSHAPLAGAAPGLVTLSHQSDAGQRDYRLYRPASAKAGTALPVVVMLHGCTQSPDDFAAGTGMNHLAEEFGLLIAYPAQPSGANAQKCWNWFRPSDQDRDRGEPALIAGIARDILRDHGGDSTRVYVAGLSAGGAAAAIAAAAYPDVFSAVGVHSGLPVGAASDIVSAFSAMRQGAAGDTGASIPPTIILHGDADTTVHPSNADAVAQQVVGKSRGLKRKVQSGKSAGGRTFRRISHVTSDGVSICEQWTVANAGHAWAGGSAAGSYTDPAGPDASREMVRFFLQHRGE
ncbi:MAG: PHB depolymerase family esterase [Pseudomonadota bacterium]